MNNPSVDLVIIGGGIAGLWTLAAAKAKGFQAILLEKNSLGCGQTIASQGIIHGGSKYALAGSISRATNMISDMPHLWKAAIANQGDVNLAGTQVLSNTQHLIPSSGIDTQLLSFLGSKNMASHTEKISKNQLPDGFSALGIERSVFRLNEIVLNVESLLKTFKTQFDDSIFQADIGEKDIHPNDHTYYRHRLHIQQQQINTANIALACGEGNGKFGNVVTPMQKRPLHMVMMKGPSLPAIYAHFIGRSSKPLLTITSHPCTDGETVWYMGGDLAENGVELSESAQIEACRQLLKKLLPHLTLNQTMRFGTFRINRAEPAQNSLTRPDDAFVQSNNNIITGWPTKLALSPRFAEKVLELMPSPSGNTQNHTLMLPKVDIARFPWDSL